jgi:hypothetical protein
MAVAHPPYPRVGACADRSGFYCRPNQTDDGVIFLAEAALGKQFIVESDSWQASSLKAAPGGYHSVRTAATSVPDPKANVNIDLDGRPVMLATGKPTVDVGRDRDHVGSFLQREYLVVSSADVHVCA